MLDYTDISTKIEDVKTALNNLYELVYAQYDGVFEGENAVKYQRLLQSIKGADSCMNEANDINCELADAFEEELLKESK